MDLTTLQANRKLRFKPHPGQWKAWNSPKRFICVLAGTQGGKTSFGPHWLLREMKRCGPGDYLVVTPTFQLLEKKALPELLRLFQRQAAVGRYVSSPSRKFTLSDYGARKLFGAHDPETPTTIWFGYAEDPESLESATAKAAWLDECGQKKFKIGSWEAIQRRLSIAQGRVLMTTTPYDLGWLKQRVWDKWRNGDPDYEVIRFDSTENPTFPKDEYERARRELPRWKFDMFYRAIFTRPAGMIYDNFMDELEPQGQLCKPFAVPDVWRRFVGLDFGGVNTAALFYAEEQGVSAQGKPDGNPTGRYFLYREYLAGGRTAKEHAEAILRGEPRRPTCVGGSKSEGQWRQEFSAGGLSIMAPPIKDVEVGINRVYGAHANQQIVVFDTCAGYREQKMSYSRALDDAGEPTEAIEDKETFHFMDAERYIISHLRQGDGVTYGPPLLS